MPQVQRFVVVSMKLTLDLQGDVTHGAEEKDHGKGGKRKAGASLRQRLEKRLKSAREPGPAHSRPSRGFVFIK